jgi:D-alanyl-D-alanine carboxypeptidase
MNQGVLPGIDTGIPSGRNGPGINTSGSPNSRQGPNSGMPLRGSNTNPNLQKLASSKKTTSKVLEQVNLNGMGKTYLAPEMASRVAKWTELAAEQGIKLRFNEAFRTSADQAAMVRNVKAITPASVGTSLHEAGYAVDVNYSTLKNITNGLTGDEQRAAIRKTATEAGLKWGGVFTKKTDPPHFYHDPGGNRSEHIKNAQLEYLKIAN